MTPKELAEKIVETLDDYLEYRVGDRHLAEIESLLTAALAEEYKRGYFDDRHDYGQAKSAAYEDAAKMLSSKVQNDWLEIPWSKVEEMFRAKAAEVAK